MGEREGEGERAAAGETGAVDQMWTSALGHLGSELLVWEAERLAGHKHETLQQNGLQADQ